MPEVRKNLHAPTIFPTTTFGSHSENRQMPKNSRNVKKIKRSSIFSLKSKRLEQTFWVFLSVDLIAAGRLREMEIGPRLKNSD